MQEEKGKAVGGGATPLSQQCYVSLIFSGLGGAAAHRTAVHDRSLPKLFEK